MRATTATSHCLRGWRCETTEEQRGTVRLANQNLPYRAVHNRRLSRPRCLIDRDGTIVLEVPSHTDLRNALTLLRPFHAGIQAAVHSIASRTRAGAQLAAGKQLPYLGKPRLLRVTSGRKDAIALDDGALRVTITDTHPLYLRQLIEAWYRQEASRVLMDRVTYWAGRMSVTYGRITVRDQRSRWGSCAIESGNLSFNWRIILAPLQVLDYLVIHELAHRREPNHSKRFWAVVAEFSPDHKAHRAWMKANAQRVWHVFEEEAPGS